MRIQEVISQSRRDFTAVYACESCGGTRQGYGYDDANFHNEVIPNMKCKACGATSQGVVTSTASIPDHVVL